MTWTCSTSWQWTISTWEQCERGGDQGGQREAQVRMTGRGRGIGAVPKPHDPAWSLPFPPRPPPSLNPPPLPTASRRENKSLNIFNSRLVLASPETATDGDYARIEGVVGHEYFHNWTGNRVTCRCACKEVGEQPQTVLPRHLQLAVTSPFLPRPSPSAPLLPGTGSSSPSRRASRCSETRSSAQT